MEIKENDVFRCSYTEEFRNKMTGWDLNHCFERILIAMPNKEGNLWLFDTYWGIRDKTGKSFTIEDIGKIIEVEYVCNLDDYEEGKDIVKYYDDADYVRLTRQHGCTGNCVYYFLKKGAVRSKDKMQAVLLKKIDDEKLNIQIASSRMKSAIEDLKKLEDMDINKMYL